MALLHYLELRATRARMPRIVAEEIEVDSSYADSDGAWQKARWPLSLIE
jgi:hypothetical protein